MPQTNLIGEVVRSIAALLGSSVKEVWARKAPTNADTPYCVVTCVDDRPRNYFAGQGASANIETLVQVDFYNRCQFSPKVLMSLAERVFNHLHGRELGVYKVMCVSRPKESDDGTFTRVKLEFTVNEV